MNKLRTPTIRLHLWLETDDGLFFGYGRAQLLEKIEEYGSLKKAADSLGMSYRAAWGKIKASEATLGIPLIVQSSSKRKGCQLTSDGKALTQLSALQKCLLAAYKHISRNCASAMENKCLSDGKQMPQRWETIAIAEAQSQKAILHITKNPSRHQ